MRPELPALQSRLVLVLVAGAVLVALAPLDPPASVWLTAVITVGLVVVDALLAQSPASVVVEREIPPVVALDQVAVIRWHIRNASHRKLRLAIADQLAPSLGATGRRARVVVPPRGSATVEQEVRPRRRGLFMIDELAVRVTGPLGLIARQRPRHLPVRLRVYPAFRSRAEAELRLNRARILEVGLRSARGRGGGTEFDQLREYSTDDETRRIDWAATARSGRPIVRTYRAERNQTVLCLLDNGRIMAGRVGDAPRVEYAMDAIMAITTVASRLGDRCGLVAFDREVRSVVAPAAVATQLNRVTEAMFDLEPVLIESDYRGAFTTTIARFRRRALLVILTDLVEQAVGEALLPALPLITRRHLVVIGSVTDPMVAHWATAPVDDAEGAFRRAAAVTALEERRRTTLRLRAAGATVVDALPGELAVRLVDTYLGIKATNRL